MRTAAKTFLLLVVVVAAATLTALAIWILPEVSSLRATFAASASSTYPPHVILAFLATEDPHFLEKHDRRMGAATLVQQMVKGEVAPSRQISRVIKEVVVAAVIDRTVPESQIISGYLDHVYLGSVGGRLLYGVPIGSRTYFHRDSSKLTLAQAAMLAGIVRSPRAYSPIEHAERAAARQQVVLDKMRALKFVTEAEYGSALREAGLAAPNSALHRTWPRNLVGPEC